MIVLVVILAVAVTIGIDLERTRFYTATANVQLLSQNYSASGISDIPAQAIVTDIQLFTSADVKAKVAKILRIAPPAASVTQIGATSVVSVSVTSPDPRLATRAANTYVKAYIAQTQSAFLAQAQAAEVPLQKQINTVESQITATEQQLAHTPASQASTLTTQLNQLNAQQQTLQSQLVQIQINTAQASSGGRLVSPATVPTKPSSPKPINDAIVAFIVGLAIGVAIALLNDFLDDRIKSHDDLEAASGGLATLGLIPNISYWVNRKTAKVITVERPNSPPSEAYRGLRTSIQFVSLEQSIVLIEVTSSSAGDGKTTTSANLAVSMAESGQRVILVSCDLRKPRIHEFFGLPNSIGFTSVLLDETSLSSACLPVPGVEGLWLLPSGPAPPNPSELLGSQRGRALFQTLGERFDAVIIDTSPVLPVTDAAVIATIADAVLVVCSAGKTTVKELSKGLELLKRVDAPILGTVLNQALASDAYVYYHYGEDDGGYGYGGYGSESNSNKSSSKRSKKPSPWQTKQRKTRARDSHRT
jgi:polysaccharide biosynthesis transport protein